MSIGYTNAQVASTPAQQGEFLVRVVDYDDTIIKEEWLNTNDVFELPEPPTHVGLTFDTWSSPVQIVNNKVTVTNNHIIMGPVYHTTSGKFEIYCSVSAKMRIALTRFSNSTDWGDGTGTSASPHIYENAGNYWIKTSRQYQANLNDNPAWEEIRYDSSIITLSNNTLGGLYLRCPKRIMLSNNLKVVDDNRFNGWLVKSLIFPNTIESLGQQSSRSNKFLENLVLPYGLTTISSSCFSSNTSLEYVSIPNTVTTIGTYVFDSCYSLKNIKLPDNLTTLDSGVFSNCYALEKVILPEGLTSIGNQCFRYCPSLKHIDFPSTLTSIGERCFREGYLTGKVTLPLSLTTLANEVFYSNYGIREVEILSHNLTTIPYMCFYECIRLEKINLPEGLTTIGDYAFYNCSNIREFVFPSSLTTIGNYVFQGSSNYNKNTYLYDFRAATSVPALGSQCFNYCFNANRAAYIVVPDNLYSTWINETNWSDVSANIISATDFANL